MKVKTLKPHANGYGEKFNKDKGDEYTMPGNPAANLIKRGFVKVVEDASEAAAKSNPSGQPKAKPKPTGDEK